MVVPAVQVGQPNSMREMIDWLNSFALDAYCLVDNTQVEQKSELSLHHEQVPPLLIAGK